MTIQEAVKAGRMFRRPEWSHWYFIAPSGIVYYETANHHEHKMDVLPAVMSLDHILAEDWEVKQ